MSTPAPQSTSNLIETICADLQAHWAAGERIPVETYLLRHPEAASDADALLELVLLEVALREEAGETPSLKELTGRFPQLGELLRRQLALHGLLHRPPPLAAREFRVADYVLIREIGRGGMGTVYEARHRGGNHRVALKMLSGAYAPGAQELERFAVEAEALTRLRHPHIVQIHEVGLHQSQPFIAFELIEGGTLADRLRQGELPAAAATVAFVATLAWTVEAVHQQGVVHRDLKPANILLLPVKETDPGVPKIADFGLAKLIDSSKQLTRSGEMLGTPAYLAPEQVSGGNEIGPPADIYGLGAILYEMLTGHPPFRGASAAETLWQVTNVDPLSPSRARPGLPRELATICLKCLEKSPGRRYPTAAALARDLECWLRGERIHARPVGALGYMWRHACRRPLVASLLATLFLALVLGLLGATWSWRNAESHAAAESALRQEAEASLYRAWVSEAALHWMSNNVAGALQYLEQCTPRNGQPDQRGWEWHYMRRLCNTEDYALRHRFWVRSLAVSPDGTELAVATGKSGGPAEPVNEGASEGELVIWDIAGTPKVRWRQGDDEVRAVSYSPDGHWLAFGTSRQLHLLDRRLARVQHSWPQSGPVSSLCFRGDSRHLACGGILASQAAVRVYDVSTGNLVAERTEPNKFASRQSLALAYSPDNHWLASQYDGRELRLWGPLTGQEKRLGATPEVSGLAFLAGGGQLASAGPVGGIIWDCADGREIMRLSGHRGPISAIDVAADGRSLVTGSTDQTVRLWDGGNVQEIQTFRGHTWTVRAVAFAPDGRKLFSGGKDCLVKCWDVAQTQRGKLMRFEERMNAITFAAGGRVRAVRLGGHVRTWAADGAATDSPQLDMIDGKSDLHCGAVFLWDGDAVVSISRDDPCLLKIWDAEDGRERLAMQGHTLPIHAVALGADGRSVVSTGWDSSNQAQGSEIKVWEAATGRLRASFMMPNVLAFSLALSPDGTRVAIGEMHAGPGRREAVVGVSLWDISGKLLSQQREHRGLVSSVAFSADGSKLASAGFEDENVCLMDAASLHVLHRAQGPHSPTCLTFDPAGRRLAVIGHQGTVHLFDAVSGQEVFQLPGMIGNRDSDIASDARVLFSADGHWLLSTNALTARSENTLNLWDGRPFAATTP